MTAFTIGALVAGLVGLVIGAELLVRGAASIASRFGIAPVVVGLTVVAFGTSAPELAVSLAAALGGSADVAVGNVVGSNIANILLILGASAVVGGLAVEQRIVRVDIPLLILVSVVVFAMALDSRVSSVDGLILVAGVVTSTGWLIREARSERADIISEYAASIDELEGKAVERPVWSNAALATCGLGLLVVGSQLLVGSATTIAEAAGVSDLVIGLTVVAIGTSLPELATSIMAVVRGQRDIAVGNVIGSNLFNLMSVLGFTSMVSPGGIEVADASIRLDLPVMLAATVVLLPIVWGGFVISRWEGAILVGFYATYMLYLVLDATGSTATSALGAAVLICAPLVATAFVFTGLQGWRRHRHSG